MNSFASATRGEARRRRAAALLGVLAAAAVLSGCVAAPPPGPILSRLPPDAPGAAASAQPLTAAEKKRYDEIDKQVMREQDAAMAAGTWVHYYTPYYYPAPMAYGGYYSGWGLGYYSPGFYPGWWW